MWQPTATIETLKQRAAILKTIRDFFDLRHVTEVTTPSLASHTVTDPYIQSIVASITTAEGKKSFYLQTSPEYHMKRLLTAGSGDIFQICKSFRDDEAGRLHNPEFTLLEWYRLHYDDQQLMDEMDELFCLILNCDTAQRFSYQQIFLQYTDIDPLSTNLESIKQYMLEQQIEVLDLGTQTTPYLQFLFEREIEPQLQSLTFIYDFPAAQSSLARIQPDNPNVAARFEAYYKGIEVANGFHELQDAEQQRQRFISNQEKRRELGVSIPDIDEHFLAALEYGLPDCAGVAVGLDRLVMLALNKSQINTVLTFDHLSA